MLKPLGSTESKHLCAVNGQQITVFVSAHPAKRYRHEFTNNTFVSSRVVNNDSKNFFATLKKSIRALVANNKLTNASDLPFFRLRKF